MTINTNSAQLKFTQKPGALVPADPAQTDPNVVTLSNGKQYRITIEILVNGKWTKVDQGSNALYQEVATKCQNIYATMGPANATSFTLYMQTTPGGSSFTGATLGRFFTRFADAAPGVQVVKIEYKTDDSDKSQIMELKDYKLPLDLEKKLQEKTQDIALITHAIFANREKLTKDGRKDWPGTEQKLLTTTEPKVAKNPQLKAVEQVLNVTKNNGEGNKCAAISVAMILLQRYGDLQTVKAAILSMNEGLALPVERGRDAQDILTNLLIDLAANVIESRSEFSNADPADSSNPYYANVVASLRAAGRPQPAPNANRKMVVKEYADLIRSNGEMLDVSFFDALNLLGISSITLKPSPNGFVLGSIYTQNLFKADIDHIEGSVLGQICFVVHDQLHYRAAMLPSNLTAEQTAALSTILRNDMAKLLQELDGEIPTLQPGPSNFVENRNKIYPKIAYLMTRYPTDAKPRIIALLTKAKRIFDVDTLNSANGDAFIQGALLAFLGDDMNKVINQIRDLAVAPRAADAKFDEMVRLITSVVTQYPADAKPIIIQLLTTGKKVFDADISMETDDDAFIRAAADAFLNPTN